MTCSYFLRCKQGMRKWHPIKTRSGGVRCRFGTQCPALLLPALCCVHGGQPQGAARPLGCPSQLISSGIALWRDLQVPQEPQTSEPMRPPHIPAGEMREGTNTAIHGCTSEMKLHGTRSTPKLWSKIPKWCPLLVPWHCPGKGTGSTVWLFSWLN